MAENLMELTKIVGDETPKEEQLTNELVEQAEVAAEILERQKDERIKSILTNPSAIALSTTVHDSGDGIQKVKKNVKQLFILYLTNQFVSRAINIRADTIISKGFEIVGDDTKGVELCSKLIEESGGKSLIWQTAINTYIAGDGFLEKIYNSSGTKILGLKHVHPLTLEYKKDDKSGKILVDKNKEPIGFVQYYMDKDGKEIEKQIDKNRIAHHKFNSLGDEFTGLSSIQPGYATIVRLMNMEYSAAEAAIKTANPLIVGTCNTKSPAQIALWGQILGNINGRDQIFVPQDMEIKFLSPGQQNFSEYADYFLNAVVATFGVPKSVLLGDSSSGSKAEGTVLTRHFYTSIASDQQSLVDFFQLIFKEYGELAGFKPPKLVFGDVAEDAGILSKAAIELLGAGIISVEEARSMIGLTGDGQSGLKKSQGVDAQAKQRDKENYFPKEAGKPAGSQAGIKSKQKMDPNSDVSPFTK